MNERPLNASIYCLFNPNNQIWEKIYLVSGFPITISFWHIECCLCVVECMRLYKCVFGCVFVASSSSSGSSTWYSSRLLYVLKRRVGFLLKTYYYKHIKTKISSNTHQFQLSFGLLDSCLLLKFAIVRKIFTVFIQFCKTFSHDNQ